MKTFLLFCLLLACLIGLPAAAQQQKPAPQPTLFDMVLTLSKIRDGASSAVKDMKRWKQPVPAKGPTLVAQGKALYKTLQENTNGAIRVYALMVRKPAAAKQAGANATLTQAINDMLAANKAFSDFYALNNSKFGGDGLGITPDLISTLTGGASAILDKILSLQAANREAKAKEIESYLLPDWSPVDAPSRPATPPTATPAPTPKKP